MVWEEEPSPDEVDYLKAIAFCKGGVGPDRARGDVAVVLYRNAVRLDGEFLQDEFQRGVPRKVQGAGLAVDLKCEHRKVPDVLASPSLAAGGRLFWAAAECMA